MDAELEKLADIYVQEQVRLEKYLEDGESIRIWYSDAPYSRCGFYSLCKMLQKYDNDIYSVKLPEYKVHIDSISLYQKCPEFE